MLSLCGLLEPLLTFDNLRSVVVQNKIGYAVVSKSQGLKMASEGLKGRVFDVCLDDLKHDESAHRKVKLIAEDVKDRDLLTNFHGMDFTTDKLRSLVKKWQSLIEAFVDVKTTDGYVLRLFCIGFTRKAKNQIRKTSYAQSAQVPSHCVGLSIVVMSSLSPTVRHTHKTQPL